MLLKSVLKDKIKKRLINIRDLRLYYLIVCEGAKTEPNYFESIKKELPVGLLEIKIEGTGRNTLGLVKHAKILGEKSTRKFDKIWVVFDRDSFPERNFNPFCSLFVKKQLKMDQIE